MQRIGIITFHCANNYGAVLQAFALEKKLQELSIYNVQIIDYRPKYLTAPYKPFSFYQLKNSNNKIRYLVSSIYRFKDNTIRFIRFNKFRKEYLMLDKHFYPSKYSLIITGSDQIWNPVITKGLDPLYFGQFKNYNGVIASYAASIGIDIIENELRDKFKILLSNYDEISVREKSIVPFVQSFVSKKIVTVLDPVFLLNENQWASLCKENIYGDYLLVYCMFKDDQMLKDAQKIANDKKLKIIEIAYGRPRAKHLNRIVLSRTSPIEFLSLFYHAKYILTNSFHGTAYSIIFKKQFCAYHIPQKKSRISDLLDQLNLLDRYVENADNIYSYINWEHVYKILSSLQEESINYLKNLLLKLTLSKDIG